MPITRPYTRTRSRVVTHNTLTFEYDGKGYTGSCDNPSYPNPISFWVGSGNYDCSTTETMTDVVTPGYRKKQSKGQIVNTPMDCVSTTVSTNVVNYDWNCIYCYYSCSPTLCLWRGYDVVGTRLGKDFFAGMPNNGWASDPNINIQSLIDIAVTQMWANADHSKAAALATLGEAKETIHSMISIIGRLIKIIIALKKLDVKYLYSQIKPKELASRYMELRYAIRPLYYDVKQIIAAANHRKLDYDRYTFRGYTKASDLSETSFTYDYSFGDSLGTMARMSVYGRTQRDVTVRSGLLTHVSEPSLSNVWGFDQLFETAWELMPFSFIIDWFFNVGQTIASWTPEAGIKPLASWYKVTDTIYRFSVITNTSIVTNPSKTYVDPKAENGIPEKSEKIVHTYRVPDPNRSVLPTFNLKLDTLKLIDLLIIARQIYSR